MCQILFDGDGIGTGFLVAPDLVMSNWHVFEDAPGTQRLASLEKYSARFDYRASDEHTVASIDTVVGIDSGRGYLDQSIELELDYVIVKLVQAIGNEPLANGKTRGGCLSTAGSLE